MDDPLEQSDRNGLQMFTIFTSVSENWLQTDLFQSILAIKEIKNAQLGLLSLYQVPLKYCNNRNSDDFVQIHKNKAEKIQEDILDSIPSSSASVKIQMIGGKVYLRE